jgi:hypothetical protein
MKTSDPERLSYATPRTGPAGSVPLVWKLIVVSLSLGGPIFLIGILTAILVTIAG